jgi:hypothetical protein
LPSDTEASRAEIGFGDWAMRSQTPKAGGNVLAATLLVALGLYVLLVVLLPAPQHRYQLWFWPAVGLFQSDS